jgi:hypothetical protein
MIPSLALARWIAISFEAALRCLRPNKLQCDQFHFYRALQRAAKLKSAHASVDVTARC